METKLVGDTLCGFLMICSAVNSEQHSKATYS